MTTESHRIDAGRPEPDAAAEYARTRRGTPTRHRERARYDRRSVHAVLDEALTCHLGYTADDGPVVLPTFHARVGETLYLHGSTGAGVVLALTRGGGSLPVCVTATLVDGVVLARSALHHSLNYRSVVIRGDARQVTDEAEKRRALAALLDHIVPGRSADSRPPDARELAMTAVLSLDLAAEAASEVLPGKGEASGGGSADPASGQSGTAVAAKVRASGPLDDGADLALPHWAGVLPLRLATAAPVPADDLAPGVPVPGYLSRYRRPGAADQP